MKAPSSCHPFIFYSISFLLFFVDLAAFSFFERPIVLSLLCYYIFQLSRPLSLARIFVGCLLLSLMGLVIYGRFGLDLLYVIPATLMGIKMRNLLYNCLWHYDILLILALLGKIVGIEHIILGLPISASYTFSILFVNIVIIKVLSLKWYN